MFTSQEPPTTIVDEASEVVVTNPAWEWYMKGKKDARLELEYYRKELDQLALQLDAEISAVRQKTAQLKTLIGGASCSVLP